MELIIQFLNLSLLMVSSILTTPPMLVYQECTFTELTKMHVCIIMCVMLRTYILVP